MKSSVAIFSQLEKYQMNPLKNLQKNGQYRIAFMPIKPVYVDRILSGQKLFEFRRTSIRGDTTHLIIYSSSPIKMIVGVVEVRSIITASPTATWERTKHAAGISRRLFREYFKGSKKACAIEIQSVFPLKNPLPPHEIIPKFHIPQSYRYVDHPFLEKVIQLGMKPVKKNNQKGKLIFVGGIHGAGKSTLCTTYCNDAGYEHLTASTLIKNSNPSFLGSGKQVRHIKKNQDALITALSQVRKSGKNYVLDGHFTLLDAKGTIRPIPVSTFEAIKPDKLIVITESPETIMERLELRDRKEYDKQLLDNMQESEIKHANRIADALKVSIHTIYAKRDDEFSCLLRDKS